MKKTPFKMLTLAQALDTIQGPLAPVIAFSLWTAMATQVLSRSWFYIAIYAIVFVVGLRSFHAMLTKRVSTLRRIAILQEEAGGTVNDRQRRRGTLKDKALILARDLLAVFAISLGIPAVFLFSGAPFSSRRTVIMVAIIDGIAIPQLFITNTAVLIKLRKSKRRLIPRLSKSDVLAKQQHISSHLSEASVLEASYVPGGMDLNQAAPGLFSEIDSEV
jgi:hypothetical protein